MCLSQLHTRQASFCISNGSHSLRTSCLSTSIVIATLELPSIARRESWQLRFDASQLQTRTHSLHVNLDTLEHQDAFVGYVSGFDLDGIRAELAGHSTRKALSSAPTDLKRTRDQTIRPPGSRRHGWTSWTPATRRHSEVARQHLVRHCLARSSQEGAAFAQQNTNCTQICRSSRWILEAEQDAC